MSMFNPTQICDNYMEASVKKANSPMWRLLVLGFAAGAFIAFGATGSSTAAHAIGDVGVARLVTGLVFPVGLVMVVFLGVELFTGNALMVNAALEKKIRWRGLVRNWVLIYFSNFAGAIVVAFCMSHFGQFDIGGGAVAVYSAKVAATKASLPWANALVMGIFCNILVCIAVYVGSGAKDATGKILGLCLPIVVFVAAGFEHCIANMYYIPAGIFANSIPAYAEMIAAAGIDTSVLNFGTFVTANLIPVTIGNIIGGVLVGLMMYFPHGTRAKVKKMPEAESPVSGA